MGVRLEPRSDAVVVRLDWPEKRNSIGPTEAQELSAALESACLQAPVGVVLTGVGAFCAGGDLRALMKLSNGGAADDVARMIYSDIHSVLRAIDASPVPVVAAVDGAAVGFGFDLALLCDMCFVGPEGWLQQGWAIPGLVHGTGGNAVLAKVAPGASWRLIAEQTKLDCTAASELGIAERANGTALDAAIERIGRLSALPRQTLEAYTRLERSLRWPSQAFLKSCVNAQADLIASPEFARRAGEILGGRGRR